MILKYNNIDFLDIRYDINLIDKDRMLFKSSKLENAINNNRLVESFNTIPCLKFYNCIIHQASAIEQFLSDKFNMNGSNDYQKSKIYSICEYIIVIKNDYQIFKICNKNNEEKLFYETLTNHLKFIDRNICNNNSSFSVGYTVTRLDIALYNFVKYYFAETFNIMKIIINFKNIVKVIDNLEKDTIFKKILQFNKETSF